MLPTISLFGLRRVSTQLNSTGRTTIAKPVIPSIRCFSSCQTKHAVNRSEPRQAETNLEGTRKFDSVLKRTYDNPDWILSPDHSTVQERLGSCNGKVAVVTGGARGIGAQIALGLAEAGASVAILDILKEPVAEEFAPIDKACTGAKYYQTDVSSPKSVAASFQAIVDDFGSVDICVAAAGVIREKPFVDVTPEELEFQVNVNMIGMFYSTQHAARQMIRQENGGAILVIASMGSHAALRDQFASCYVMTKWAVRGWVKQVAMELGKHKIRVNSLSPGYTQTALSTPLFTEERIASWPHLPFLDRMGRSDELKGPAVFLCSDASSYITGTDLLSDGGVTSV